MWRYLLLIILVVLSIVIARLPARLLTDQLPAGPVQLLQPAGTLWHGRARMVVDSQPLGLLDWRLNIPALLGLEASVDFTLAGDNLDLTGAGSWD